jgi:hypothetical protein
MNEAAVLGAFKISFMIFQGAPGFLKNVRNTQP